MPASPFTHETITALTQELGLILPAAYEEALLHYPFPSDSEVARTTFFGSPDLITEANQAVRVDGFLGHGWPDAYLVIGTDGIGDLNFLDTNLDEPNVQVAEQERSTMNEMFVDDTGFDLTEWLDRLIAAERRRSPDSGNRPS